jgi:ABC-type multidrug transport system permease subunit
MFDALFLLAIPALWLLCFLRPGAACGLALSGFALEQCAQAFVPMLSTYGQLFNYVVASSVIVALARQLMLRGPRVLVVGPAGWATTALLAYTALTLSWSIFPSATEASLLLRLPFVGLFVFLAPHTVQDQRDIEDLFMVVIFGTALALVPLLLFAQWAGRSVYLGSTGEVTNPLALTQVAGNILIGGALTPMVRQKSGRAFLPVASALALIVLVTFLRTQSRGQIVAAIAVTAILAAVVRGGRIWLLIGAIGMIWILGSGLFEDELATNATRWDRGQMTKDLEEDRVSMAVRLLEYWYDSSPFHQVFGLGHATAQDPRLLGSYPHVVPAEILAEEGIVGAGLYLVCLIVGTFAYVQGLSGNSNAATRAYLPAFFGLYCFEFLLTLKQGTLTGNTFFLLILVLSDTVKRCVNAAPADARQSPVPESELTPLHGLPRQNPTPSSGT